MPNEHSRGRPALGSRWAQGLLFGVVSVGAAAMFFPFLWTLITSISSRIGVSAKPSLIPQDPSLDAYRQLFTELPFGRVVLNSLGIAFIVTVCQVLTSALAGYAFMRLPFRGRGIIFAAYLATMMVPGQVLLVPQFVIMKDLGLVDTYPGVILPSVASVFGVFLFRQAIDAVPRDLDEAARLDGAGHFRIFWQVILPLLGPTTATLSVFAFMGSWNSFLWPLVILRSREMQTLPLALAGLQGQYTTHWDLLMAGSVISIVPMLIIYLFAQKYVVRGVAGAGLK
ncbi:MAG: carbohydrate ABC transporter permease [Bifidobacteriaceae bacterium]|jgi:multiple sugar transport system permease protein|nr:carbohydrate ABC transporter permease [Bifidobacteriaceae bacterium]